MLVFFLFVRRQNFGDCRLNWDRGTRFGKPPESAKHGSDEQRENGLPLAAMFAVMNAMWFEMREDKKLTEE